MRRIWWVVAVAAFLVMLYQCALPGDLAVGPDSHDGLAGTYTVNGVNTTGVEYSGTVVITAGDLPDSYDLEWIVTGSIQEGTGRLAGDRLTVEWETVSSAGGAGSGTADYTLEPDGRLVGTRSVDGLAEVGTEEIFPEA
jgi:hypothetical protein